MDIDMQQLNLSGKFCTLLCFYLTDSEPVNDQQNIGIWDWTENEKRVDPKCTLYRISYQSDSLQEMISKIMKGDSVDVCVRSFECL